jgi:ubiquinone/menaquinone biosynthesis C-methylase UbiE
VRPNASDLDLAAAWLRSEKHRAESLAEVNECLLSTAGVSAGCRVVEVGAGTGETTLAAARAVGPAGSVTALDSSAPMIEALTRRMRQAGVANFSTLVTRIEDADLPRGTFDAAIGRYVLMLLGDPVAALAKIRTSLRTGTRAAMAVFASRERNPFFSIPSDIFCRHGRLRADDPDAPSLYRLGDPARLKRTFTDVGFGHVTVDTIESPLRIDSVGEACKVVESAPFIRRLEVKLSAQQRAAAWREVEAYLRGLGEGSVVSASTQSLIAGGVA